KLKKGSLQIKKRNLEAKQSKALRICVDEHAYACCSYPNPRPWSRCHNLKHDHDSSSHV
ncbi:hypothetical protein PIB30_110616, partial [Stylosanthes scabra]|nr:hypothetical protein [Stylosanthes scabra]